MSDGSHGATRRRLVRIGVAALAVVTAVTTGAITAPAQTAAIAPTPRIEPTGPIARTARTAPTRGDGTSDAAFVVRRQPTTTVRRRTTRTRRTTTTQPATTTTTAPAATTTTAPATTTTAPPTTVAPAAAPSPSGRRQPSSVTPIAFSACRDSIYECAFVRAPVSYADPDGPTVELFVSRRRATSPELRIGTVFVNPGGPGGPTYDLVRSARDFLTPEVLARFDVIGVDPRGTARSAPLACDLRSFDSGVPCGSTDPAQLNAMDTETAARDLEVVRAALGEERISYVGFSYGTYLGAVYRALFPTRVRAMVLDSAVDPARFGLSMLLDPLEATERALDAFLDECASGRLQPCNFNDGTDLRAKYLATRERAIAASTRGRERGERDFDQAVAGLVGFPRNGWPILGRALQEVATTGTGNFTATAADNQATLDSERIDALDQFSPQVNVAVNCRDGILPRDPSGSATARGQIPVVGPRFTGLLRAVTAAETCVRWPAATAPAIPLGPQPAVPTLIVTSVYDLTTPLRWAQGLSTTLAAPLLVRNGGGHGAAPRSACIRTASAALLIELRLPAPGFVCSPDLRNPS